MIQPFSQVMIVPSYSRGFTYLWSIHGDFNDPGPWSFQIQESQAPEGPWKVISPELKNIFAWKEDSRSPVNKSAVLYFNISLKTSRGSYVSPAVQPYGTLSRRDFLVAREVMRQSVLHSRGMAGVPCKVYLLSTMGPKCHHCIDPITGMVRDSHCKYCFGTGRDPAYNGPYDTWIDFSEDAQHQQGVDKNGTVEKKTFQARTIGSPVLKHGDVIVDPTSDKRYIIDTASMTTEMRRIPIIQTLTIDEAPQTDKVYDL